MSSPASRRDARAKGGKEGWYNEGMYKQLEESSTKEAARMLLGQILVRMLPDGERLSGRIVETEAYHQSDPASHTFRGQTPRNAVMFGPAGRAYVYFTYGMHYCFNVTSGREGEGSAVLIRALEPLERVNIMHWHRFPNCHSEFVSKSEEEKGTILKQGEDGNHYYNLCSGPAKLCQALAIDKDLNGHNLGHPPLRLLEDGAAPEKEIVTTTRVGIKESAEAPLRFYIKDNPFISKK